MNPIWKNMPRSADRLLHRGHLVERERRRLFAERRFAPAGRGHDEIAMRVGGRDDYDRVHRRVVDERERIGVVPADVELLGTSFASDAGRIGDRYEAGFGNSAGQVARVHTSEPPESNQSNRKTFHFTLSLVTSSSFTLMSSGTFSP